MNNPLVSIIIPAFNRADLITETLDSVLAQTYGNWECLIIDDGSSDNTAEVVSNYLKKDSRFKYYNRPTNRTKGANACRNYGFEIAQGKYINWFDSDDVMFEELIEKKIEVVKKNGDLDAVISRNRYSNFEMSRFRDSRYTSLTEIKDLIFLYGTDQIELQIGTIFWKREFLNHKALFDEKLQRYQDNEFHLRTFCNNPKFEMLDMVLATVRGGNGHESQISSVSNLSKRKRYDIFKYRLFSLTKYNFVDTNLSQQYFNIVSKKAIWSLYNALASEPNLFKRIEDISKYKNEIAEIMRYKEITLLKKLKMIFYLLKIVCFR